MRRIAGGLGSAALHLGHLPCLFGLLRLADLARYRLPQRLGLSLGMGRSDPRLLALGLQLVDPLPECRNLGF